MSRQETSGSEAAPRRLDRALRWLVGLTLAGALGFAGWVLLETLGQPRTLAGPGLVEERRDLGGPFELVDQEGRAVTEADFADAFALLYFGYSFCPDICPTTLLRVAGILDELPEPQRVRPVLVTVDPARDTPARLADYLAAFGPRFVGLTGPQRDIDRLARRFGVVYRLRPEIDPEFYPVDHSSRLYLMDRDWRSVAVLDEAASDEQILEALRRGLEEAE